MSTLGYSSRVGSVEVDPIIVFIFLLSQHFQIKTLKSKPIKDVMIAHYKTLAVLQIGGLINNSIMSLHKNMQISLRN